jgi:hypothetical protein
MASNHFAIMVPIQNYIQQFQLARGKANKGPNRVKLIKYLKIFRTNDVSAMIFGVEPFWLNIEQL